MKWARLDLDPLALAFWQLVVTLLLIGACLVMFDGRLDIDRAHAPALIATAFAGIVGSGIAYAMWFAIVRRLSAATASLGTLGIPVVGVLATVLMVGERPTVTDLAGFALILAAAACALWCRPPPTKPSRPRNNVDRARPITSSSRDATAARLSGPVRAAGSLRGCSLRRNPCRLLTP